MVPQKQAEAAMVMSETEQDDQREEERADQSILGFKNLLWHGGSVYDAWFSCASNQVNSQNAHISFDQIKNDFDQLGKNLAWFGPYDAWFSWASNHINS